MTEKMLLNQIKIYEGNVKRNKRLADYYYSEFKKTGSHNAYLISQNFYREVEHCKKIIDNYKKMIADREFMMVYGN